MGYRINHVSWRVWRINDNCCGAGKRAERYNNRPLALPKLSFGSDGQIVLSLSFRRVKYRLVVPPELLEKVSRSLPFHFVDDF